MKYALIFFTLFTFSAFAQHGGLRLTVLDNPSLKPIAVCTYLVEDSTESFAACSDELGCVRLDSLAVGSQILRLSYQGIDFGEHQFFVQPHQVLSTTLLVDTALLALETNNHSVYDLGPGEIVNQPYVSHLLIDANKSFPSSEIQQIGAVRCVAYRVPLFVSNSGTMGTTIHREDVVRLPQRSVSEMAGRIGGVLTTEGTDALHIRGARSDATVYYVDGMRVQSLGAIPKSFVSEVTVYTGGIPANYGDLTGGVISVVSKPIGASTYVHDTPTARRKRQTIEAPSEEAPKMEPRISADRFHPIYENMFLSPKDQPHSTFGLDVDRASWTYLKQNYKDEISRDAVKLEEMINAFNYRDVEIPDGELIGLEVVRSNCLWDENHELLSVHMKAMDLPKDLPRKSHNFVFLVDVSGSMESQMKLGLLKSGLSDFVKTLEESDQVSIVTYAGYVGVALNPTSDRDSILVALDNLNAGGSTNGMGGIQKAYELAESNFDPEKNNRIILCTDGDFNVGISDTDQLETYISEKRGKGIYLTALGFGMGNYRNDILESLADRGDGNHFYINSRSEMDRVLCKEIGNIMNIARDVKLDVAFDPTKVVYYRLIGYENRLLQPEDFVDDSKDGGEIGYSHTVTAVYEIERVHDSTLIDRNATLATVKLRYKPFEEEKSVEREFMVKASGKMELGFQLNTVIGFGLLLRDSAFKGNLDRERLYRYSKNLIPSSEEEEVLLGMIANYRE